jgi:uncharacterized protein YciI
MTANDMLNQLPTLAPADIQKMIKLAQDFALVILRKGPASRADEERNAQLQLEHLQHLAKLQLSGKLAMNGPILVEHDILGISIYAATMQEAKALAEADPKVKEGYLTVEVLPWMAVTIEQMVATFQHLL